MTRLCVGSNKDNFYSYPADLRCHWLSRPSPFSSMQCAHGCSDLVNDPGDVARDDGEVVAPVADASFRVEMRLAGCHFLVVPSILCWQLGLASTQCTSTRTKACNGSRSGCKHTLALQGDNGRRRYRLICFLAYTYVWYSETRLTYGSLHGIPTSPAQVAL